MVKKEELVTQIINLLKTDEGSYAQFPIDNIVPLALRRNKKLRIFADYITAQRNSDGVEVLCYTDLVHRWEIKVVSKEILENIIVSIRCGRHENKENVSD